jgi:hypothetical protein
MYPRCLLFFAVITITLTACGEVAQLPFSAGVGSHPQLPPPNPTLIPTVNIAQAAGWPENGKPVAAPDMAVNGLAGASAQKVTVTLYFQALSIRYNSITHSLLS